MVAVTGANGLLGSFVIRKLIAEQTPFVALRRQDSDISLLDDVAQQVTWREANVLDPVALWEALKDVTSVIHAAATVSINPRHAEKILSINVEGTRNVVNACLDLGIKRLVHISSVGALGAQRGQQSVNESNAWIDSPFNSVYAKSKYYAELEVFRGQEEGLSTVIVNPSVILAEANWNNSSAQFFRYAWDERAFYIDSNINYVDVTDVAGVIFSLLNDPVQGKRFIVSAGSLPFKTLITKIAAGFGKGAPTIKVPKTLLRPLAFFEGIRARLTATEPKLTRESANMAGTAFRFENTQITNYLDFRFQPIDETIQRCCRYYIHQMNSKK